MPRIGEGRNRQTLQCDVEREREREREKLLKRLLKKLLKESERERERERERVMDWTGLTPLKSNSAPVSDSLLSFVVTDTPMAATPEDNKCEAFSSSFMVIRPW